MYYIYGIIRGSVIGNDYLKTGVILKKDASKARTDSPPLVSNRDKDGNGGELISRYYVGRLFDPQSIEDAVYEKGTK
jgi:hypothetical protein